jgi:hypothetical protein
MKELFLGPKGDWASRGESSSNNSRNVKSITKLHLRHTNMKKPLIAAGSEALEHQVNDLVAMKLIQRSERPSRRFSHPSDFLRSRLDFVLATSRQIE